MVVNRQRFILEGKAWLGSYFQGRIMKFFLILYYVNFRWVKRIEYRKFIRVLLQIQKSVFIILGQLVWIIVRSYKVVDIFDYIKFYIFYRKNNIIEWKEKLFDERKYL